MQNPTDSSRPDDSRASPPTEAAPPTRAGALPQTNPMGAVDTYQHLAETVGGVPSMRVKDNVVQALTILIDTVIAAAIGLIIAGLPGLLVGALIGMFVSLMVSGVVLMVLGWIR